MNNRLLSLLMTLVMSLALHAMEPAHRGPKLFKAPAVTTLANKGSYVATAGLYVLSQVHAAEQETKRAKAASRELTCPEQCMGFSIIGCMASAMCAGCVQRCLQGCDAHCTCCPNRHPHSH